MSIRSELIQKMFGILQQVELTEFIKIGDALYEVNTKALCPDDRFTHSRNVVFPVSVQFTVAMFDMKEKKN